MWGAEEIMGGLGWVGGGGDNSGAGEGRRGKARKSHSLGRRGKDRTDRKIHFLILAARVSLT